MSGLRPPASFRPVQVLLAFGASLAVGAGKTTLVNWTDLSPYEWVEFAMVVDPTSPNGGTLYVETGEDSAHVDEEFTQAKHAAPGRQASVEFSTIRGPFLLSGQSDSGSGITAKVQIRARPRGP